MTTFQKPALPIPDQLLLLKQRGLVIEEEKQAAHYLLYVGYYRLSAYMKPFQEGDDHTFKQGTRFKDVLALYLFDGKLRLHLLDALERIEIALRSVMNDFFSASHGAHWYLERDLFKETVDHTEMLEKLRDEMGYKSQRKRETFIAHYLSTYTQPPDPPAWMMVQTLSMGSISKMYEELKTVHQKPIALKFGLDHQVLISVLHSLAYVRNLCAHHSRVWNREFRIKPKIPKQLASTFTGRPDRLGAVLLLIDFLLAHIAPQNTWQQELNTLLAQHPTLERRSMGL